MPGAHLSHTELQLKRAWDARRHGQHPLLTAITVNAETGPGLRGIKHVRLDLSYPVTFLSGQNGSGKSTLLALAALAYHGFAGHQAASARRWTGEAGQEFSYYTFQDFFFRGPGDEDVAGAQISWEYSDNSRLSITKRSDKWMHYERRPRRPVEFIGLARAVPAMELPNLRNHFGLVAGAAAAATPLSERARELVERVLARQYPQAELVTGRKHSIRRTGGAAACTSFNMGAGEDGLIAMLVRLVGLPMGSLVIIEEIETGLHPAAQQRFAAALIELARERQLQIIGSTHSHHVLDFVPREARVLVLREGGRHRLLPSPSTQLALSEMSETAGRELLVICEDEFAARLITHALPKALRRRVDIRSCGSKSELMGHARSYARLVDRSRCIVIWDGDVPDAEALGFLRAAQLRLPSDDIDRRVSWARLPGDSCPEKWALDAALHGLDVVTRRFGLDSAAEAQALLERCEEGDPHRIPRQLGLLTSVTEEMAAIHLLSCAHEIRGEELDAMVAAIAQCLA